MNTNLNKIEQVLGKDHLKLDLSEINLDQLGTAIYQSLEGIQNDLDLSQTDLANILHISTSTLSDWKKAGRVKISSQMGADDMKLLYFIDLYDAITSLYKKKEDYRAWFREPLTSGELSPIEMMKDKVMNIVNLSKYVNWLINP